MSEQDERLSTFPSLLNDARQGESEAISVLYRQFLPGIFWYIAARVPDRSIAEDLTSEVFLEMVEGIHKVRAKSEATFASWLFQIARITVAGYYRKREHVPASISLEATPWEEDEASISLPTSHPDTDPVRWAEARDEWLAVAQAINALTEEQRQVLVSRLILGYDVTTVAQMVGKKENAVKALQFRALNSLQRLLRKRNSSEEASYHHVQHQEDTQ
ncbi:RNA polymerase sigma factor [Reticulibacter mediterranei]|uniref:RNA polymerase sigma factor n=1 Tax=Reticulibacter mediterranei TaxID=2778369 RepID=A0A8J3IIG2_9CHLR|nr:sigma-70 family RNA polymerase sigma factor [Reticulibacter mediterranei]GHO95156.1 RNA polymerase sigma factor [Reticulibacter mediterranei]